MLGQLFIETDVFFFSNFVLSHTENQWSKRKRGKTPQEGDKESVCMFVGGILQKSTKTNCAN